MQELTPYRAPLLRALAPVVEQTVCSQLQRQVHPLVQQFDRFRAKRSQKAVRLERRQRLFAAAFEEAAADMPPGAGGAIARENPQPARPPFVEQPQLPVELPHPGPDTDVAASVLVAVEGVAAMHQPAPSNTIRYFNVLGRCQGERRGEAAVVPLGGGVGHPGRPRHEP